MNNSYCVCTTPNEYHQYKNNWENFYETGFNLTFISDITTDPTFNVGFTFTENEIRK